MASPLCKWGKKLALYFRQKVFLWHIIRLEIDLDQWLSRSGDFVFKGTSDKMPVYIFHYWHLQRKAQQRWETSYNVQDSPHLHDKDLRLIQLKMLVVPCIRFSCPKSCLTQGTDNTHIFKLVIFNCYKSTRYICTKYRDLEEWEKPEKRPLSSPLYLHYYSWQFLPIFTKEITFYLPYRIYFNKEKKHTWQFNLT